MNRKRQFELYAAADERRRGITLEKGAEYTGDSEDVLLNFKSIGARLGIPPLLVLAVYLNKHMDSFNTFVKRHHASEVWGDGPDLEYMANEGEGIVSRMDDARNYLDLGEALICDSIDEKHLRRAKNEQAPWEGIPKSSPRWEEVANDPLFKDRSSGLML